VDRRRARWHRRRLRGRGATPSGRQVAGAGRRSVIGGRCRCRSGGPGSPTLSLGRADRLARAARATLEGDQRMNGHAHPGALIRRVQGSSPWRSGRGLRLRTPGSALNCLVRRQTVPIDNLHRRASAQLMGCRGCFVWPAGRTQSDISNRSSSALVTGPCGAAGIVAGPAARVPTTSGVFYVGRSTRCEFGQVRALPPGRSVSLSRPSGLLAANA
jgi:hypothetical protein